MKARSPKAPPIPAHPGLDVQADEAVWDGRFPLQRVRFTYQRFDGARSAELTWELWRRGRGVAVLPDEPTADAVALIEQFRLPALAAGFPGIMTECAAGLLEQGEDPEAAARPELEEETGLHAGPMECISRTMLLQGGCDETMFPYAARVTLPEDADAVTHGLVHEGEAIRGLILPAEEAFTLLDQHRIENATAGLCLWWLRHHRARLRQEWA